MHVEQRKGYYEAAVSAAKRLAVKKNRGSESSAAFNIPALLSCLK